MNKDLYITVVTVLQNKTIWRFAEDLRLERGFAEDLHQVRGMSWTYTTFIE